MSGLSMSQVPYLRGLRGLGASAAEAAQAAAGGGGASAASAASAAIAAALAADSGAGAGAGVDPGAQEEVDSANASAAALFSSQPPLPQRPARVSPLSVSWSMPLQTQPIRSRARHSPKVDPVLIGGGVVLGVVALYLILGD